MAFNRVLGNFRFYGFGHRILCSSAEKEYGRQLMIYCNSHTLKDRNYTELRTI